jgi:hypothetical protein
MYTRGSSGSIWRATDDDRLRVRFFCARNRNHDLHPLGTRDHMCVREDIAIGIDDDTRSEALLSADHEVRVRAAALTRTVSRYKYLDNARGHARDQCLDRAAQLLQWTEHARPRLSLSEEARGAEQTRRACQLKDDGPPTTTSPHHASWTL